MILANRSAKEMMGDPLPRGVRVSEAAHGSWEAIGRIAGEPSLPGEISLKPAAVGTRRK